MMMMSNELLFLPLRIEKQLLILRIQKANLELKTINYLLLLVCVPPPHLYSSQQLSQLCMKNRKKTSEERDNLSYGIFKCLKEKFSSLMRIMLDFRAPISHLLIFLGGSLSEYHICPSNGVTLCGADSSKV